MLNIKIGNHTLYNADCLEVMRLIEDKSVEMYRYDWVWIKDKGSDPLQANKRPLNNIENIIIFYKRQPIYNPQKTLGEPYTKRQKNSKFGLHLQCKIMSTDKISDGYRFPLRNLYFARDTSKGKFAL